MEAPPERGLFRGNVDEYSDAVVSAFLQRCQGGQAGPAIELDMSMQKIRALQALQLSAPQVTSLDLNGNFITALHPQAFDSFRLEHLNLGSNDLKEFAVLPSLTRLRSLCLNSNKLTRMVDGFSTLAQLESLQMRKNKIEVLNLELLRASAASLSRLTLACNWISSLVTSPSPSQQPPLLFPRLVFLGLFGNRLVDAQGVIESLARVAPNLEQLILAGNRFPADKEYRLLVISSFAKLQWLDWLPVTAEERNAALQIAGRKRKAES